MEIIEAIKLIFVKEKRKWLYIFGFIVLTLIFIFLFAELQVLLTIEPDNIFMYFQIWRLKDWLMIITLSILISLNFVFFIYFLTRRQAQTIIQSTSTTLLGTLSAIFSGILATALCSSCLVALFSLLGISFASGILLLKYRFWIFIVSILFLLISLHLTSKKINKTCEC
ncbi:hypothetical protein HRbin34_00475 [bacterium HR34]|nr:hypothetical protein HRbin34_00475 [bacterium HR34]